MKEIDFRTLYVLTRNAETRMDLLRESNFLTQLEKAELLDLEQSVKNMIDAFGYISIPVGAE